MTSQPANLISDASPGSPGGGRPQVGAYYLNAKMYTAVPAQVREDMEWMADKGTDFVCVSVLEPDIWAARENLACIIDEAMRAGMRVLGVPARWAGLTAGAPKVPSTFSVLNPRTWMLDEHGSPSVAPKTSGVISSVHWPETLEFFKETLSTLYTKHPRLAGFIIDEPKAFRVDHSPKARERLGAGAPRQAHVQAAADFFDQVCAFAKERFPEKITLLHTEAHHPDDEIEACVRMRHLDYVGIDGRPWDLATDQRWDSNTTLQESGKGKVLLSGRGERVRDLARRHGKKSLLLIENHNLTADMKDVVIHHLPAIFALRADLYLYYYFPRNVHDPVPMMEMIGEQLRRLTGGSTSRSRPREVHGGAVNDRSQSLDP